MAGTAQVIAQVTATVAEVLPGLGLAYLDGDDQRSWAVTKSTRGAGLQALQPGTRVKLLPRHFHDYSLVSEYVSME